MSLQICIGGMTGWTGKELAAGIRDAADLTLMTGISRKLAGQNLDGTPLYADVKSALQAKNCDIYIDYTHPSIVKQNVMQALELGVSVVVGTSGLSAKDYEEIDQMARAQNLGVIASGNFSITAALLQHFSLIAAKYVPDVEIIDYAKANKPDAPSGTARELAEKLGKIAPYQPGYPMESMIGPKEIRGADVSGSRVHAIRLPGFILSVETLFGAPGERLSLRHDAGESAKPYVTGTLLAARRVIAIKGLVRGLDQLLFGTMN